jgi:hypothetical protein
MRKEEVYHVRTPPLAGHIHRRLSRRYIHIHTHCQHARNNTHESKLAGLEKRRFSSRVGGARIGATVQKQQSNILVLPSYGRVQRCLFTVVVVVLLLRSNGRAQRCLFTVIFVAIFRVRVRVFIVSFLFSGGHDSINIGTVFQQHLDHLRTCKSPQYGHTQRC